MRLSWVSSVCSGILCSPTQTKSFAASYAQQVKKSKPRAGQKVAPAKQQFMKRRKEMARRPAVPTASLKETLTESLFEGTNQRVPGADAETLQQRATIGKAWSRLQMVRLHAQSSWERAFLQSKLHALEELRKVSPKLGEAASAIDYTLPPSHRRLPAETPPHPEKFPYSMSVAQK